MSPEQNHPNQQEPAPKPPKQSLKGLNPLDSLTMSRDLLHVVNWLCHRKSARFAEIQAALDKPAEKVRAALDTLVEAEQVLAEEREGEIYYRVVFGGQVSRGAQGLADDIWNKLEN